MNSKMPGLDHTDDQAETQSTDVTQPQAETELHAAAAGEQAAPETAAVEADAPDEAPVADNTTATEADGTAEASAADSAPPAETAEPEQPEGPRLKRGELVDGLIVATTPTQVTVEVNGLQGVIPSHELEKMNKATLDQLQEGATIPVFVVNPRGHDGLAVLSVNRAMEELDWRRAEEFRQSQEVVESRVAGYNKGGLIVRFGRVRGFVPQSQMSAERRRVLSGETPEERWGKMVNEPIAVKVMEVDRARNRLILSERAASRESREKRKEHLISQLTKGEVRTGRVVSLEDFGAFVDIGGAEGLVHLTELSWKHVTHPREMLQIGQEVQVEVISIDRENKRIGLSIKSQEQDPWDMVAINYNVGQLVLGTVTKLTKFGAFARLVEVPEIEGLIHISELSDRRVTHPKEVVQEGDRLTLRVVKMDIADRRLGLSLKKVNSPEYLDQDWLNPPPALSSAPVDEEAPVEAADAPEAEAEPETPELVETSQPVAEIPAALEAETEPEAPPVDDVAKAAVEQPEPADTQSEVSTEAIAEAAAADVDPDEVAPPDSEVPQADAGDEQAPGDEDET